MAYSLAFDLQRQIQGQGTDIVPNLRQHVNPKKFKVAAGLSGQLKHPCYRLSMVVVSLAWYR